MGKHDALGLAGRPARRDHERIAGLDRFAHPHRGLDRRLGGRGQPLIDGEGRVAGVPDAAQRVDEVRAAGQVERDELWRAWHRPIMADA